MNDGSDGVALTDLTSLKYDMWTQICCIIPQTMMTMLNNTIIR